MRFAQSKHPQTQWFGIPLSRLECHAGVWYPWTYIACNQNRNFSWWKWAFPRLGKSLLQTLDVVELTSVTSFLDARGPQRGVSWTLVYLLAYVLRYMLRVYMCLHVLTCVYVLCMLTYFACFLTYFPWYVLILVGLHASMHTCIQSYMRACMHVYLHMFFLFTHLHCMPYFADMLIVYVYVISCLCIDEFLYWFHFLHAYNDMYLYSDQFDVCVLQKDEIDLLVCMLCFQLYGLCLTIFILICVRMLVCVFNCGLTVGFCSAFIFAVVFICKNMYMCFIYSISRNGPIGPKKNMDKQSSPHQNLVRDWFWCGNLSFL